MQVSNSANVRFADAAAAAGMVVDIVVHEQSSRTAAEAAAACDCDVAQIVKSLVFRGASSGEPLLLLVSGANRVNEARVAELIGEALNRPDANFVRDVTGFAIGGIPPFGNARPIKTYIDADLIAFDLVWAAAGTPNSVFACDPKELARVASAETLSMV